MHQDYQLLGELIEETAQRMPVHGAIYAAAFKRLGANINELVNGNAEAEKSLAEAKAAIEALTPPKPDCGCNEPEKPKEP